MSNTTDLQSLLRFLTQQVKIPLATALSKVKPLQIASLDSPLALSKAKAPDLLPIFEDNKLSKQIISAAKRVTKKRAAGEEASPPKTSKKQKGTNDGALFSDQTTAPEILEESLKLPTSNLSEQELCSTILHTNRAPLVLAFLVILLKHTLPSQPLSTHLSLAQAYVSITSRSRAVNLGIESGSSAEEDGFGQGQPTVTVAGKEIKVLKRWGFEWVGEGEETRDEPALWALDLEAMKRSGSEKQPAATKASGSNLPIYTPQSARVYLLKAFDTAPQPTDAQRSKKVSAAAKVAEKEENLGKLLRALEMVYDSWAKTLSTEELDKRTWGWYVKVRPSVEDGVAGWGGKNSLKLSDILALRNGT